MRRPDRMRRDDARCIRCGACEEIAPDFARDPHDVPVTPQTLDAMTACPTGAEVWREEERGEGGGTGAGPAPRPDEG